MHWNIAIMSSIGSVVGILLLLSVFSNVNNIHAFTQEQTEQGTLFVERGFISVNKPVLKDNEGNILDSVPAHQTAFLSTTITNTHSQSVPF